MDPELIEAEQPEELLTPEESDEPAQESDAPEVEAEDDGEVVVSIGDEVVTPEPDPVEETPAIRQVRQHARQLEKELREARRKLQEREIQPVQVQAVDPGPAPKLEDFGFDEDKFSSAHETWVRKKVDADLKKSQAEAQAEQARQAWQNRLQQYEKAKASLRVPDFDAAEEKVTASLSQVQQGIILESDRPELMVYVLGKNPKKAAELAAIQSPVKFAMALAKLETQLKVAPRKSAPAPESKPSPGTGRVLAGAANLERLREEARRTGDYSKYLAEKRKG